VPFALLGIAGLAGLGAARRKKRFMVMPDFVETLAATGSVASMDNKKFQWVDVPSHEGRYDGRIVDHVNLGEIISAEPFSDTEARSIRDRFGTTMDDAGILALAKWAKVLCTQDVELARSAVRLGVDVYDADTWLKKFAKRRN
jgi:predicted nucleic acid-binding protein